MTNNKLHLIGILWKYHILHTMFPGVLGYFEMNIRNKKSFMFFDASVVC